MVGDTEGCLCLTSCDALDSMETLKLQVLKMNKRKKLLYQYDSEASLYFFSLFQFDSEMTRKKETLVPFKNHAYSVGFSVVLGSQEWPQVDYST